MKEAIREMFLTDWVKEATTNEIIEKLIEHDERGKEIDRLTAESTEWENKYYQLQDDVEHWKQKYKELEQDVSENYTRKYQNPYEYGE